MPVIRLHMLIAESETQFRDLANVCGISLDAARPSTLFKLVFDFWEQTRALDAQALDQDGDGLLFQWGVRQAVPGYCESSFYVDLTRQFVCGRGEDDGEFFQLRCEFQYLPSATLSEIEGGNQWCFDPDGLASFKTFVLTHPAVLVVETLPAQQLVLHLEGV